MMRVRILSLLVAAAAVGSSEGWADGVSELTAENAGALHGLMKPGEDEVAWMEIPWRTDLGVARAEAAAAGKPLYLWEMDGHPLGCT